MAKSCNNCGTTNHKEARYCTSCGGDMTSQVEIGTLSSSNPHQSACLWCNKNAGFQEEEGKLDSKFGFTAHKMKIYICRNCGFAHLFGLGRTIWDFD